MKINIGNKNKMKSIIKHGRNEKDEAVSILTKMVELTGELEDVNIKGDLLDDFDRLKSEILAPTPEKTKIQRALRRVECILEPIKHITTVSTLLVHFNELLPVISNIIGSIV